MVYKLKEKFFLYYIKQSLDFNFSKKFQLSTTGFLLIATPLAISLVAILSTIPPALFIFTSPTSSSSAFMLAYISIYSM